MANRSDKFYFSRGDLVLEVGNTLFKLHQDILARHSGFFDDMLSTATSDDSEGTEANPLKVPANLCSVRAFTILCKLLYPPKMGSRFPISVSHLEIWEDVLQATAALQMEDTRRYILAQLAADAPNIKRNTAKLLRISLDYEEAPSSFLATCLRIFGTRRKQLTTDEVRTLGEEGTCLVSRAREGVRATVSVCLVHFLTNHWAVPKGCRSECLTVAFKSMLVASSDKRLQELDDTYSIFQGHTLCDSCISKWDELIDPIRSLAIKTVEKIATEARPTPGTLPG